MTRWLAFPKVPSKVLTVSASLPPGVRSLFRLIHQRSEGFSRGKPRDLCGRNLHHGPGFRVAADARRTAAEPEATKAAQCYACERQRARPYRVARVERLGNGMDILLRGLGGVSVVLPLGCCTAS